MLLSSDATTADGSLIKAPASITGNGAFTVFAQICSADALPYWQIYLDFTGNTGGGTTANFCYGTSGGYGAVSHWDWRDMGWTNPEADGGPSNGAWHAVAITFDGLTEKVYLDGVETNTEDKTLDLHANGPISLGARSWDNVNGWGREGALLGAVTSLEVWDDALSAGQIGYMSATGIPVTVSGQVTDGTYPVSGAAIQVVQDGKVVSLPTTTDDDGNYTATAKLEIGVDYKVTATKLNYEDGAETALTAFTGTPTVITGMDIVMTPITTINVSGTVTNIVTGLPAVGVDLNVHVSGGGGTFDYPVTTGVGGTYSVDVVWLQSDYSVDATPTAGVVMLTPIGDRSIVGSGGVDYDVVWDLDIAPKSTDVTGLSGIVRDSVTNDPIYNAVVQLGGKGGPAVVTDATGAYSFTGVTTDGDLYADAVGYAGRLMWVTGAGNLGYDILLTANDEVTAGRSFNGDMEDLSPTFKPDQWEAVPWQGADTSIDWSASADAKTGSQSLFYCYNETRTLADNEYAGIDKVLPAY